MHGQGNDFVMLNGIAQKISLSPAQTRRIADRHFGIGCDQILLVEAPTRNDTDFRYRIFNADGGEVEQCGNGARCFAHFVRDQELTDKSDLRVETLSGIIEPSIAPDGSVTVNMGSPRFFPAEVPFVADEEALQYQLDVDGLPIRHAGRGGDPGRPQGEGDAAGGAVRNADPGRTLRPDRLRGLGGARPGVFTGDWRGFGRSDGSLTLPIPVLH